MTMPTKGVVPPAGPVESEWPDNFGLRKVGWSPPTGRLKTDEEREADARDKYASAIVERFGFGLPVTEAIGLREARNLSRFGLPVRGEVRPDNPLWGFTPLLWGPGERAKAARAMGGARVTRAGKATEIVLPDPISEGAAERAEARERVEHACVSTTHGVGRRTTVNLTVGGTHAPVRVGYTARSAEIAAEVERAFSAIPTPAPEEKAKRPPPTAAEREERAAERARVAAECERQIEAARKHGKRVESARAEVSRVAWEHLPQGASARAEKRAAEKAPPPPANGPVKVTEAIVSDIALMRERRAISHPILCDPARAPARNVLAF